jgi:hypothetical protein
MIHFSPNIKGCNSKQNNTTSEQKRQQAQARDHAESIDIIGILAQKIVANPVFHFVILYIDILQAKL